VTAPSAPQQDRESFAEAALRLGGKTEEEARRTGAVDRADEQVEALFAARYQTGNSPVHKAVWDGEVPLPLFSPLLPPAQLPCDAVMDRSIEIVRRRRKTDTLCGPDGKIDEGLLGELGEAGYWGLLIPPEYGGHGAPFARFAPFLTRVAVYDPMIAGLASVHGCIGAVDPVRTFGTPEQKRRFLPDLASGKKLSGFALTEPCAGSDLTALRTTAVDAGDHYEVTGEKLFITNAVSGRMIGLVVILEGKPAVLIADLPQENEQFQLIRYGLYALRQAHNNGLRFNRFRVPKENLLRPPVGDGLTIAYHGLNLGRLSLCANASGTMRIMLANLLPWAEFRRTYGHPINTRELVKRRIARLAALLAGCDALVAWGADLIDQGYRGELECIVAKIFGGDALKESAIELFMKTHGGRSFLKGHIFAENVYDMLAPSIYEGEGEMLGLAFFKSLVKEHGKQFFEPIGRRLQETRLPTFNPFNPVHAWKLRRELTAYSRWLIGQRLSQIAGSRQSPGSNLTVADPRLAGHVHFAIQQFRRFPLEISAVMTRHQLKLADRQCRMAELSQRVQDTVTMVVAALWADRQPSEVTKSAADILCQDLQRKLTGARPSDRYFRDVGNLADQVIAGGFDELASVPRAEIMMKYENR
jgi:alkylation response protein AidB-like acyl-CoA dehydrogenase